MKVLVLGNGIHAKKRVIPALQQIDIVDSIVVGDKNTTKSEIRNNINFVNLSNVFESKEQYDLTLIVTPPYNHLESFQKVKEFSAKVLIEKPITNDFKYLFSSDMKNYFNEGKVIESLMYLHHPVWNRVKQLIDLNDIQLIESNFSVPHLESKSFRYSKKLGGGSLNDQGIYPISLASELIKDRYEITSLNIDKDKNYEVDLGGEIQINFENLNFIGKWGLGKEYANYLKIIDKNDEEYLINFFYSKPDDTNIIIQNKNESKNINIGVHNQFKLMYEHALNEDFEKFQYSSYESIKKRYSIFKLVYEEI